MNIEKLFFIFFFTCMFVLILDVSFIEQIC
jgi:hypothetical protein